jgi:3-dehydroquinate synthase
VTTRITVRGDDPYDVVIGSGVLVELPALLGNGVRRVAVLHQPAVEGIAHDVADSVPPGVQAWLFAIPDGEAAKTAGTAVEAWDFLAEHGFTRGDLVVGVGGGAATDLAGFVAATWLRGVRVVQVPTTLLGMVDAAVGGKTGINIGAGKNLVGAFYPPAAVLCDLPVLAGVPRADYAAGLAEVIKVGFIADPVILDLVEQDPAAATTPGGPHTAELIARAIAVKADVVGADLRERASVGASGLGREILNYGHTLAHAIEKLENYRWRHGDAVAVGMVFAAGLSLEAEILDAETAGRHRRILESVGLPTSYDGNAWPLLRSAMSLDKKTRGSTLRFVVLERLAKARILADPSPALLEAAFAHVVQVAQVTP